MRARLSPRHVAFFAFWLATASPVPAETNARAAFDAVLRSHGYRHVPLEASNSRLLLRVRINGRPAALVIDTGAPFTTLDRKTVASWRLAEAPTGMSLNGAIGQSKEQIGLSQLMTIEVANIILSKDSVTVVDLSGMNRSARVSAAGVFGLSQLRKLGAIIDCAQPALYLNPHSTNERSGSELAKFLKARNSVGVPIRVNKRDLPVVSGQINGVRLDLVVETAAFTTILSQTIARQASIRLTATGLNGVGAGGLSAPISTGVGNDFAVGAFHTREQKLSAANLSFNVLGLDYLRARKAVIDCGALTLFLRH